MAKVFRLYTGGSDTYKGWNGSPAFPYTAAALATIDDPNGSSAKHEITSIPSPFARIDLVKSAFSEVSKQNVSLDGNTIFHKMVSDTLDVGEIFFNIDKYKNQIEIITWDPETMIKNLKNTNYSGHFYYADVLEKYLASDAQYYNFKELQRIYLLNFLKGPNQMNIIGATSPATIFFSSSNDLSFVTKALHFGNDKPFDPNYQPLYKRDFEYIKFWFILQKSIPNFSILFPEINTYLNKTYSAISDIEKRTVLQNLTANDMTNYSPINVNVGQQVNAVEVLGYDLFKNVKQVNVKNSELILKSNINQSSIFVLPVVKGNKYSDLHYTTAKWGDENAAPYVDNEQDLSKRTLPFDGAQYPYLTINDFLEEHLILVPHAINKEKYFDGNVFDGKDTESYLIPLKPTFFNYFTVDELLEPLSDGKPMLSLDNLAGGNGVKVTLRIPIKGNRKINYIEYFRTYYKDRAVDISEDKNDGKIETLDFAGFFMPSVKFAQPEDAIYKVSFVTSYRSTSQLSLYKGSNQINGVLKDYRMRQSDAGAFKSETYTLEKSNFDYIQIITDQKSKGLLIPIFENQVTVNSYNFSVDLGTSNTHIEYSANNASISQSFNYNEKDNVISDFFVPTYLNYNGQVRKTDLIGEDELIEKDYLPKAIGGNSDFVFPTRTVLSCSKSIDWTEKIRTMGLVNIPLTYDKRRPMPYNDYKCNIKWAAGEELRVMESYVDNLLFMIRNMVIAKKGDIRKTRITWFYPTSMAPKRLNMFRTTWDHKFNQYFSDASTSCMTESTAPILYYFKRYATATNLVNVDIGGGTTDIAFANNKKVQYVTSFRFAANVLFENSFSDVDTNNGIVDFFKPSIKETLKVKEKNDLVGIFDSNNNIYPSNMASFLFTLKDNSMLSDLDSKSIDFNYMLQNDSDFKISFILFYTAIVYHIAKIIKVKDLELPRHIAFSGNGSKVVKIVSPDVKILSKYTQKVIELVTGKKFTDGLDILGLENNSNPKESTCKGGLFIANDVSDDRDKIIVLRGTGDSFVGSEDTYDSVDDKYKDAVVSEVKKFIEFTLDTMNKQINFDEYFGVSSESLKIAKVECFKDLKTFMEKGLEQRRLESEGKNQLEETSFFYPIKGVINALSLSIYKKLKNIQ